MLGSPTFEDKAAQRAVTMVLEEIYEQDFLFCLYGFRRDGRLTRRSALCRTCSGPSVFIGCSISTYEYFDSISHSHLRAFLDQRVTDGVIRRMIDKWLKAGAVEDGLLRRTTEGSPQRASSRPASRISSCTMCWTNGSRPR